MFQKRMHNSSYRLYRRKSSFFPGRDAARRGAAEGANPPNSRCYLTCWFVYDKLSFSFSSSWSRVPVKVLRQMYAHIYGRKHAEYLCPFANTLNDKSLWPNRLISYDLRWEKKNVKPTQDETIKNFSILFKFFIFRSSFF